MLSCEAEAFASFKQKWTLKLARTVSSIFAEKTASYRRRSNFEAFASYGMDSRLSPVPNVPFPHHIYNCNTVRIIACKMQCHCYFLRCCLCTGRLRGQLKGGMAFLQRW